MTPAGLRNMARMDLSPQSVAAATFKTVKKGFDPDEVRSYLAKVASNLKTLPDKQAAAMEARARAAIAKMQELAQQASHTPAPVAPAPAAEPAVRNTEITAGPDDSETISRTLLLAQRTADLAGVADAKVEAESITAAAHTRRPPCSTGAGRGGPPARQGARRGAMRRTPNCQTRKRPCSRC